MQNVLKHRDFFMITWYHVLVKCKKKASTTCFGICYEKPTNLWSYRRYISVLKENNLQLINCSGQ